jgi:histidinol-phosphate aminotransferase
MSRYWSPCIKTLSPYVPGEQPGNSKLIKLNTNENPYAPSPRVLAAIRENANETLRLYPDPDTKALKVAIAEYFGLNPAQIFVGNGSDEILALAFLAFFKQTRPILFPDITYSFYRVYGDLFQINAMQIPLSERFDIHLRDYEIPNGGIIFPNPNAPTGKLLPLSDIEDLMQKNSESVVIIDEAYIDFGGESAVSLIQAFPNILVLQTLSKSRSLAGLRVGMAMGDADLIQGLDRVKNSFNSYPLDRLAAVGAVAAIKDDAYFENTRRSVMATRDQTVSKLKKMGFVILTSAANFIFMRHEREGAETLFKQLRERGILVRYFNKPRISNYLRVTIGTPPDMEAFLSALQEILP